MTLLTDNNAPNNADNQTMTTWTYAWAAGSARQTVVEKLYIDNVQMDNITTCTDNGTLRTSLQYPNGRTLAYAYDAVNRLSTIAGGGSTLAEYDYKGFYLDHRDLNAGVLRVPEGEPSAATTAPAIL